MLENKYLVPAGSPLIKFEPEVIERVYSVDIWGIERKGKRIEPPFKRCKIKKWDFLIIRGEERNLENLEKKTSILIRDSKKIDEEELYFKIVG